MSQKRTTAMDSSNKSKQLKVVEIAFTEANNISLILLIKTFGAIKECLVLDVFITSIIAFNPFIIKTSRSYAFKKTFKESESLMLERNFFSQFPLRKKLQLVKQFSP